MPTGFVMRHTDSLVRRSCLVGHFRELIQGDFMEAIKRSVNSAIIGILLLPVLGSAQPVSECDMECQGSEPCSGSLVSGDLSASVKKGLIPVLNDGKGAPRLAWASSTLAADGKDPLRGRPIGKANSCERNDHARWSCQYAADKVSDSKTNTAWCEGRPGDGVGEVVVARLRSTKASEIWAGLGTSQALHAANGRPKKVRVSLLQAAREDSGQCSSTYHQVAVLGRHEIVLKDVNGYQALPLPLDAKDSGRALFVAVEILSVYPGTKYQDTCIAEIRSRS
jgi:hypothetical protein